MAIYKNTPPVVTSGLVLYLDAANRQSYVSGSTTWNDLSRVGNTTTLTSITSSTSNLEFTRNNNSRASVTSLDLSTTNATTVDFWINFKSLPASSSYTGDYTRVVCELSNNFNVGSGAFYISTEYEVTGFRWMCGDKGNAGYNIKNLTTPLPNINTWYNMSFIIDHNQVADNQRIFYLNGILQTNIGNTSNNGVVYNTQNTNNFQNNILRIGGRSTTELSHDMYLSLFKVYNRVLTASEVLQNYNATKTRFNLT